MKVLYNFKNKRLKMTTEEFNNALKSLGMSRKEFAEITKLAYASVGNWHDEKKPIPGWVSSWLDNYKKAKTLDVVIEAIDAVRQGCCSHHGGVGGCSGGRVVCNDARRF